MMKLETLEKICFVLRVLSIIAWHALILAVLLKYVC